MSFALALAEGGMRFTFPPYGYGEPAPAPRCLFYIVYRNLLIRA
jgi:hypothetical protein